MIPANMYIPLGIIAVLGFVVYGISVLSERRHCDKAMGAGAGAGHDYSLEHNRRAGERRRQPALR